MTFTGKIFAATPRLHVFLLTVMALLFFFPFLGHVHLFDWDEINFAESSREMMLSGDYFHVQINYEAFWEKPPLYFWLQSFSMKIFGVTEFAARFPNAVFGLITLLTIYSIGKKHFSPSFGLSWAMLYTMSFLPHMYFKSGIIDPVFNYFIFVSIYFLILTINLGKSKHALLSGVFTGLAVLTKGPVGLLLVMLTYIVYLLFTKFKNFGSVKTIGLYVLACCAITVIWIIPEVSTNGLSTLSDFITYQIRLLTTGDAGHEQPFFYHFVVVFLGCFPMSVFALPAFKPKSYSAAPMDFARWMRILFWVVMILFTIVKTKIVHYSSMCWLPLSFLAAVYFQELVRGEKIKKYVNTIYLVFGIIFGLLLTIVPIIGTNKELLYPYIKNKFSMACLMTPVAWTGFEAVIGMIFIAMVIFLYVILRRQQINRFVFLSVTTTGLTLMAYLIFVVPKIEQHSQRPAIEYFKSLAGKDVYVAPVGYKSYAQWYYAKVPPTDNEKRINEEFLFYGKIDKPVYFITKADCDFLDSKPHIKKTGESGGFKFYLRMPE